VIMCDDSKDITYKFINDLAIVFILVIDQDLNIQLLAKVMNNAEVFNFTPKYGSILVTDGVRQISDLNKQRPDFVNGVKMSILLSSSKSSSIKKEKIVNIFHMSTIEMNKTEFINKTFRCNNSNE
jgi:hypothetical protein